jgi:hypothetical protein
MTAIKTQIVANEASEIKGEENNFFDNSFHISILRANTIAFYIEERVLSK